MPAEVRVGRLTGKRIAISVTLDPDQAARLDEIASDRRTSLSAVAREAVDHYLWSLAAPARPDAEGGRP